MVKKPKNLPFLITHHSSRLYGGGAMNETVVIKSPAGYIHCAFEDGALVGIDITERGRVTGKIPRYASGVFRQLNDYFAGRLRTFTLPFRFPQGTDFQQQVWRTLLSIPYGETRSYGWLAKAVGRPEAARAVGQAVGRNPLPILIPCHRIIAADGSLGGFSCGVPVKQWLLEREKTSAEVRKR
jgi:methylated-DNA-[protein]-cysteine S-methyltransferase